MATRKSALKQVNRAVILSALILILNVFFQISLNAEEKCENKPSACAQGDGESQGETDKIVLTAGDIKNMNARTITELLNQVPGISAGESSVKLRGSYKVRVFLDGRPINDLLSSHGGIKWNLVSLDNIERIEIYKGSGAVAFGDGTSGGAIIITSKKISGSRGNIEVSAGNLNTQNYSLNYQQDIEPFGLGLSLGWDKKDGFRVNNDKDKQRIGVKVNYEPRDQRSFDLSLDYSKEDAGRAGLPAYPSPRARAESEAFSSIFSCKAGRIKTGTHFSRFEKRNINPDKSSETTLECWSLGENLTSSFSPGRWGVINTGLNLELAQVEGNKVKSRQEEKYGVYASKDIDFETSPFNLGLGLRMNFYSEFDQAINPEFKVGFDSGAFNIQTAVSKTNNTPSFLQRYYETSTTTPNSDLGMEQAINYSLTVSHQFRESLEESVTLFLSEIEDKISYVRGDGGIGSYQNLGEVTRKGVETQLKWKPNDFLEIKPSYTYLLARDEQTGNWLSCSAKHRPKIDIQYKPTSKSTLTLNTKYISKQFTRSDNKTSVPGYFIADFRADYFMEKVGLFFKVKNLFDKSYYYGDGYPAPPRTWLIGANYEF